MRILVSTTSFPRFDGDVPGKFILDLAYALTKAGHQVTVVCPSYRNDTDTSEIKGITLRKVGRFLPWFLRLSADSPLLPQVKGSYTGKLRMIAFVVLQIYHCTIEGRKADVLHSHWLVPSGLSTCVASTILSKPHVVTIHGAGLASLETMRGGRILATFIVSRSEIITTVSRSQRDRLFRLVSPDKAQSVTCVPMGVVPSRLQTCANSCPRDKLGLLFVGRIAEKKGLEHLIEALSMLADQGRIEILEVCGSGQLEAQMRKLAQDKGLSEFIWFRGYVSDSELAQSYARANLVVVPSVEARFGDVEGVPVVLLESMFLGKTIVATRVGGIVDVLGDFAGILVEQRSPEQLASALMKLLANPGHAKVLGARAARIARRRYTVECTCDRFCIAFQRLLPTSRGSSDPTPRSRGSIPARA